MLCLFIIFSKRILKFLIYSKKFLNWFDLNWCVWFISFYPLLSEYLFILIHKTKLGLKCFFFSHLVIILNFKGFHLNGFLCVRQTRNSVMKSKDIANVDESGLFFVCFSLKAIVISQRKVCWKMEDEWRCEWRFTIFV